MSGTRQGTHRNLGRREKARARRWGRVDDGLGRRQRLDDAELREVNGDLDEWEYPAAPRRGRPRIGRCEICNAKEACKHSSPVEYP